MSLPALARRLPRDPAARGLALGLLLVLIGAPSPVGAEPGEHDAARRRLVHPLAAEREAAERAIAADDAAGRGFARELVEDPDPALRRAGWRVLSLRPGWLDAARCRRALCDGDAQVAVAAARALIRCAAGPMPPTEALLPAGSLEGIQPPSRGQRASRALSIALADELERAPADRVPAVGLALGEGIVPALVAVAREDRYHNRVRSLAVTVLGRIGAPAAATALVDLTPRTVLRDRTAVFGALMDVTLDEAQRRLLYTHLHFRQPDRRVRPDLQWRFFFRGGSGWGGWAERGRLRQLVRVHPPLEDVDGLRTYYRERLASRRRHPSETIDIVRGLVALGGIEADDVELIVEECFESLWQPRWRARSEELGTVLVLLHDLRAHRERLRASLRDLFDLHAVDPEDGEEASGPWQTTLPRSVEAWGQYALGAGRPHVEALATELIRGAGEVPIWSARRLGARLWARIGDPPAALVREILADGDAWLRREGLRWLDVLPEAERVASLERLRADEDDGVFLAAIDRVPGALRPAEVRRALDLALRGTGAERGAAWRRMARAAGSSETGSDAAPEPPALDGRLAQVHRWWIRLGLGEDLPAGPKR